MSARFILQPHNRDISREPKWHAVKSPSKSIALELPSFGSFCINSVATVSSHTIDPERWSFNRHVAPVNSNGFGIFIWESDGRKLVQRVFKVNGGARSVASIMEDLTVAHKHGVAVEKPVGVVHGMRARVSYDSLVTEHLEGETLGNIWLKKKSFPWNDEHKEAVFRDLTSQVALLHKLNGVHGHTHFQNILLTSEKIVLLDPKYLNLRLSGDPLFEKQATDIAWMVSEALHTGLITSFDKAAAIVTEIYGSSMQTASLVHKTKDIIRESEEYNPVAIRLVLG